MARGVVHEHASTTPGVAWAKWQRGGPLTLCDGRAVPFRHAERERLTPGGLMRRIVAACFAGVLAITSATFDSAPVIAFTPASPATLSSLCATRSLSS